MDHTKQILDAAGALFYGRGVQAVGMDEIRNASGVSLKRLYQSFSSKEELVVAYLDARDEHWMQALTGYVDTQAEGPAARTLAVFDWLATWFAEDDFRGCGFLNAFGELAPSSPAVAEATRRHKDRLHAYLAGLALDGGAADPGLLADQLLILVDGATVTAMMGRENTAESAKAAAVRLMP